MEGVGGGEGERKGGGRELIFNGVLKENEI